MDLIRHLVFENPLTLWVILGAAALACGVAWKMTGSTRARTAALACLVAGVLLGIVAWTVETDYERVVKSLDIMGRAAGAGRADEFIERVSPDFGDTPAARLALVDTVRLGFQLVRAKPQTPSIRMLNGRATVTQAYEFSPAPGARLHMPTEYRKVVWEGEFAPDTDGQWRLRSAHAIQPARLSPEDALLRIRRIIR